MSWTIEEDQQLLRERQDVGENRWTIIAKKINEKNPHKTRNGKQCRDRYVNFVATKTHNSGTTMWSFEQVKKLHRMVELFGFRWTQIANQLSQKSENSVKNKFYSGLRKVVNQINMHSKNHTRRNLKPLKLEAVCRILAIESNQFRQYLNQEALQGVTQLRAQILRFSILLNNSIDSEQASQMGEKIRVFNSLHRKVLVKYFCRHKRNKGKQELIAHQQDRPEDKEEEKDEEFEVPSLESLSADFPPEFGEATTVCKHEQQMQLLDELDVKAYPQENQSDLEKEFFEIIEEAYQPNHDFYPN